MRTPATGTTTLTRFVYVPSLLLAAASAIAPPAVIAVALESGASVATAGFVATAAAVGSMAGTLPAARLIARYGATRSLVASILVTVLSLTGMVFASTVPWMVVFSVGTGVAATAHVVARLTWVAQNVNPDIRSLSLTRLGLWMKVGLIVGPLIGAGAYALTGVTVSPIVGAALLAFAALALHLTKPRDLLVSDGSSGAPQRRPSERVLTTLRENRKTITPAAIIGFTFASVRHIKYTLIPLIAFAVGFNLGETNLLISVAGIVSLAGIWGAARVTRKHGIYTSGLICSVALTLGLGALAFSPDGWLFIVIVLILDIGLGFSAGFLSSVFTDAAPIGNPAPTLGILQLVGEAAAVAGPAVALGVIAVTALPAGAAVGSVVGLISAAALVRKRQRDATRYEPLLP